MKRIFISGRAESMKEGLDFIKENLRKKKVPSAATTRMLLLSEEILAKMIECMPEGEENIKIDIGGLFGNVELNFKAKGEPFEVADIEKKLLYEDGEDSDEINEVLRRMISRISKDSLNIEHVNGSNSATLYARRSHYAGLAYTLIAMVLGIITGMILQDFLPEAVSNGISSNLFVPIYTVFMNALKMIVGPLVFFSIASSISDFGDIKALGRMAVKIVIMYLFTSMIAVCVGYLTYNIFPIGKTSLADAVSAEEAASTLAKGEGVTISVKDTLVGIVPSDIVTPFQQANMLEIIFMAMILGIAAAALSKKHPMACEFLSTFNAICSKITTVLVSFIPLVVFCSMAKMMIGMKLSDLANVILWVPVIYLGDILMICVYCLLLLLLAKLNPFTFIRKFLPAMFTAFTFASSNASLPSSMKQCDEMGISSRLYSFSLPLGATINMDGNCITLIISALFFAKIFNISVSGSVLLSLFMAIILLSVGSPGVPGGNLICIALLVPQIGIPAEAISLIMGLYPIVGMMQVCANVTGDSVVTTIVARHEKLLDMDKFYSRAEKN